MELTTELNAINAMLATVGEAPINSLSNLTVVDAITARSTLHEVTREVLSEGYTFNTDEGFPITPEAFEPFNATIPPNAISVVPLDATITVRGDRLYDKVNFTFRFQDTPSIDCNVIWNMAFDDVPEVTRQYIAIRAARRFQKRVVASDILHSFTAEDERQAFWNHRRANTRIKRKRFLFDSASVRDIHNTR